MKTIEYSLVAREKLQALKAKLTDGFGINVSVKVLQKITSEIRNLQTFEKLGIEVSTMFQIDCDYRYFIVSHNYVFYRIESDKIIIVDIFDEREDFMQKLFGISTINQETIDYWNE